MSLLPTLLDLANSGMKTMIVTSVFQTVLDLPLLANIGHSFHSLNLAVVCCSSLGIDTKTQAGRELRTSLGHELHACKSVTEGTCSCKDARSISQHCFQLNCSPQSSNLSSRSSFIVSSQHNRSHILLRLSRCVNTQHCADPFPENSFPVIVRNSLPRFQFDYWDFS